jgi:hypothetical protein
MANDKCVKIDPDEWLYCGRFIQRQSHPKLAPYVSFNDNERQDDVKPHLSFKEAKAYCKTNKNPNPKHEPSEFL